MTIKTQHNRNFLSPLRFDFSIDRLPDLTFYVQSVNIPGLEMPPAVNDTGYPFSNIAWQGDRCFFNPLQITFKVDENLLNYYSIWNWMIGQGFPEEYEQYAQFKRGELKPIDKPLYEFPKSNRKIGEIYGQAFLLVKNSQNNDIAVIKYKDVYPISLGEINFDTTLNSVDEVTVSATFKYDYHTITRP